MSIPSNLYAEKVFAEHPAALWSLDDIADYPSIITDEQRNVFDWSVNNATVTNDSTVLDEPFNLSSVSRLVGEVPETPYGEISCIGPEIKNFTELNKSLGTITVGSYFYSFSSYLNSIEIGFEYNDTTSGTVVQILKKFDTNVHDSWIFISETFSIPNENTEFRPVIKISYIGGAQSSNDYQFLVNGFSMGQWSEEFNSTSLGVQKIQIPSDIDLPISYGIQAKAYGLQELDGYYLITNDALVAKNSGIPMVYGASNTTILSPNGSKPSLILPGKGFLNNSGRYKDYTVEMWLRINSDTPSYKRIFGPLHSSDGLYVNGPFLTLKIGDKFGSHSVGEWNRPMLIDIVIYKDTASLLINGEQVILLDIDQSTLELPEEFVSGKSRDWLGFYAYTDVSPIEIDCFGIYPYKVSNIVAKRRFVYGQGVQFPEGINQAYSGTSVFIDYPFAKYSNNYNYPDIGNWNQAIVDNLSTTNNTLSVPEYELPNIVFNNKTQEQLFTDLSAPGVQNELDDKFINLRPNSSWDSTDGFILFDDLSILGEDLRSFYMVGKTKINNPVDQTLIRIEDENTDNYFLIDVSGQTVNYKIKYYGEEQTLYSSVGVKPGEQFGVGIDIEKFAEYYGNNISAFFGNKNNLRMYVGGTKNFENTFTGNIYTVGFCTARNLSKLTNTYNEYGVPIQYENVFDSFDGTPISGGDYNQEFWQYVMDGGDPYSFVTKKFLEHTASYTLLPLVNFGKFILDISVNSYWEDYVPLTYFAKYVENEKGTRYYDLDFLQFNINYPAPSKFIERESTSEWNYLDLYTEYSEPVTQTYNVLGNHLFTGLDDYEDLRQRSVKEYSYDTSASMLKSYISFQTLVSGANAHETYFINKVDTPKNGVITVDDEWLNKKYEVVDNVVIYPPKNVDFEGLAIVMHLDFNIPGIKTNPLKIRSLQLASQAFSENSFNPVGTRFGTDIYPYKVSGVYYDYKSPNPFSIYKGSTPYLYLTRNSGIQLRGDFEPDLTRGLSISINSTKANNYKLMALQACIRYDQDFFPYSPMEIFQIESNNSLIKFYIVANSSNGKRAKIYAVNTSTGQIEDGIGFYINGKIVKDPVITVREWAFLGISFANLLNFSNSVGFLRINGPIMFNNISYYQSTTLQEVQKVTTRPWFKVHYLDQEELDWDYWDRSPFMWQGVLVISSTSLYGADPSDIYKSYVGTNKIIVDDDNMFVFQDYEYTSYNNVLWQSNVQNAV